jgi:transcriptional antiterminator RfaH
MTCWYVVQSQARAEGLAAINLGRQGFQTYLPRFWKTSRHARRVKTTCAPLFPGYLFVAIDMAVQRWRAIRSTMGVARLVCNGEVPALLPATVIDALRQREDERGYVCMPSTPRFAPGDRVRIVEGVFSTYLGLFEGMTDSQRIAVLMDLLGRKVRVVFDVEAVEAI